jgi:protein-tyrosine phosphatase
MSVAREVHDLWEMGKTVAITCLAGRNRSGLVLAQILKLHGIPSIQAIELVRKSRKNALTNNSFNAWILSG